MSNGFDPLFGLTIATATTFIIGLLLGIVIKRTLKLTAAVIALVIILMATGYINAAFTEPIQLTIYRVFSQAPEVGGRIFELASLLPISSLSFLVGSGIGFWKG